MWRPDVEHAQFELVSMANSFDMLENRPLPVHESISHGWFVCFLLHPCLCFVFACLVSCGENVV